MTDAANKSVEQLVAQLESDDAAQRMNARAALVRIGSDAVAPLLACLDHPQQHVRWESAKTLVELTDAAAAEKLVAALGDKDTEVRWVVAEALIALGRDAVRPLLRALTSRELPDHFEEGAHHVLRELTKHAALAPQLKPVLQAFQAPEPEIAIPLAADKGLKAF